MPIQNDTLVIFPGLRNSPCTTNFLLPLHNLECVPAVLGTSPRSSLGGLPVLPELLQSEHQFQPKLFGVPSKTEDQALHCLLQVSSGTAPTTDPWGSAFPRALQSLLLSLWRAISWPHQYPVAGIPKGEASPSVVVSHMAEEREEAIFPALLAPTLCTAACCLCHKAPGSSG